MKLTRRSLLGALFTAPLATKVVAASAAQDLTQVRTNVRSMPVASLNVGNLCECRVVRSMDGSTVEYSTCGPAPVIGGRVVLHCGADEVFVGTIVRIDQDFSGERVPYHVYAEDDLMRGTQEYVLHIPDAALTRAQLDQVSDHLLKAMAHSHRFGAL